MGISKLLGILFIILGVLNLFVPIFGIIPGILFIGLGFLLLFLDIGVLTVLGLGFFFWGLSEIPDRGDSIMPIALLVIGGIFLFVGLKKRYGL